MILEATPLELKRSQEERFYGKAGVSHRNLGMTGQADKEKQSADLHEPDQVHAMRLPRPEHGWGPELMEGPRATHIHLDAGNEWVVCDAGYERRNITRNAHRTGLKRLLGDLYIRSTAETSLGAHQEETQTRTRAAGTEPKGRVLQTHLRVGGIRKHPMLAVKIHDTIPMHALLHGVVDMDSWMPVMSDREDEPLSAIVDESRPTGLLGTLLRLADGWDGSGSVAPPAEIKSLIPEVFSRLSRYIASAETEVDRTTGEVTFSWYFNDHTQSVTVTIVPSGRVIVIQSEVGRPSKRTVMQGGELARLGRAAVDAGLNRVDG